MSLDEFKDKFIGEKDILEREAYEAKLAVELLSEALKQWMLNSKL